MRHNTQPTSTFTLGELSAADRLLRLVLAAPTEPTEALLIPQRIIGSEAICGGLDYRILGVAGNACLALKDFIGRPQSYRSSPTGAS